MAGKRRYDDYDDYDEFDGYGGFDDDGYDGYGQNIDGDDRDYDQDRDNKYIEERGFSGRGKSARRGGRNAGAGRRNAGRSAKKKDIYKGGGKKRKSSGAPVVLSILLVVILCAAFGAKLYLDKYSYSKEKADLTSYFKISGDGDVPIIWGNELSDIRAKEIDGTFYMDLESVQKNLNSRFYYGVQNADDSTGMILYALPDKLVKTVLGSKDVAVGDETQTMDYIPARKDGDTVYLALEFVKQYTSFGMQSFDNPTRLQIDTSWDKETVATASRNTQIRTSGGIKSSILEQVKKGDKLTVLEKMDKWSKVKSEDAIIGYVENKRLTGEKSETPTPVTDYQEPTYAAQMMDGKVNMAFHNVWGKQGNVTLSSYMAPTKTVNVVAPTWYWVSSNDGDVVSAAEQSYVDQVHGMGDKVWAVVDNFNSTDLPDHNTFLATLDSRTKLINTLISEAQQYGIDGINVDFEQIDSSKGQDYIEFIREISIACRNAKLTLSVDDYPSYDFNSFYDIKEQAVFADYVVIMGYDEHYYGSEKAGSVASIGYVTEGIKMALDDGVPKTKLINAIPFYAPIWTTTGGGTPQLKLCGMQDIQNYISEHGMTETWDADVGQNYAERTDGDSLIQIWVEDAKSIKEKLDVMQADDIAGVAEWRLQFETADVWDVIADYMNS